MTENLLDGVKEDPIIIDESKNYFEELVGENKKFKDTEALAKGKHQADMYVKHLESRLDEMRNDYLALRKDNETKARLEDMIKTLQEQKISSNNMNPDVNEVKKDNPPFNPDQLDSLVAQKIEEHNLQSKRQQNFQTVKKELEQRFGPNYQDTLQKTIENLDLDLNYVNELAHKSPKALFKTLGMDQKPSESFQAPPRSTQRPDTFRPSASGAKPWSYYQNLKKTDPSAYWNPKTNTQMMKDAIELGDSFKDGDYRKFGDD